MGERPPRPAPPPQTPGIRSRVGRRCSILGFTALAFTPTPTAAAVHAATAPGEAPTSEGEPDTDTVGSADPTDTSGAPSEDASPTVEPPDEVAAILSWAPSGALLTRTLKNGMSLVVAQDRSLAVGAIALSFPTGYADDPEDQPGLTRALALHLEQGNREIRPGGRLARIHDSGGHSVMAVGAKQTRYESLVPVWSLWDVLDDLTGFVRAPTVNEIRWQQSVSRASSDRSGTPRTGAEALASAWADPALTSIATRRSKSLAKLHPVKVRADLDRRFAAHTATLIIVSPFALDVVASRVEALYESAPPRPRVIESRTTPPLAVAIKTVKGRALLRQFAWAIEGSHGPIRRARVICGALNRQPRMTGESPGAKLKCVLHEDPRRPTLQVSTTGLEADEARAFVLARLTRLAEDPVDADVIDIERRRQAREVVEELHTPLSLVSLLSQSLPEPRAESGKRGTLAQTLDLEDLLAPGMVTAMAQRLASRLRDASASTAPATVDPPEPGEALGAEPAEDDVSSPAGGSQ